MTFATADEANRFLVAQVLEEAGRSGVVLSTLDEHELRTPGCGHTIDEDEQLDAELPAGYSHWALRSKAARLMRRAYYAEPNDQVTRGNFEAAYRALRDSAYLLTNLHHVDSPILNAVERLHVRSAFEFTSYALAAVTPLSLTPPDRARRPVVIVAVLAVVACGLFLGAVWLLWR